MRNVKDGSRGPGGGLLIALVAGFVASTCLSGCLAEPLSLRLDLCPGPDASARDLRLLQNVASWNIEVLAIEHHDVSWRRVWAGSESLDALVINDALPRNQQLRLLVEGFGLDDEGLHRVVALGASGLLVLQGAERVCLCMAPPESYEDICGVWSCAFDIDTGRCESPR